MRAMGAQRRRLNWPWEECSQGRIPGGGIGLGGPKGGGDWTEVRIKGGRGRLKGSKFGAEKVGLDPWDTREPREVYEQECHLSVQRYSKS